VATITLAGVRKVFGKTTAVDGIDLEIADGELMVLLGPSGCGKTTLLRCVAGLEYPEAGRVRIGERDVTDLPPRKRDIAMVFQSYAVFPHLKVFDNIAFGLRMRRLERGGMRERVERVAALVALRPARPLSGPALRRPAAAGGGGAGDRDGAGRAADGRAAVQPGRAAAAHLPGGAEEAGLAGQDHHHLRDPRSGRGAQPGRPDRGHAAGPVVQCDTPNRVYAEPASRFVGGFIGNPPMNFLAATLRGGNGHRELLIADHRVELPAGAAPSPSQGGDTLVGIRAENIRPATEPSPGALPARVQVVEPLGSHLLVTVSIGARQLKVVAPIDFPARPERDLWLRLDPDKLRLFEVGSGERVPA